MHYFDRSVYIRSYPALTQDKVALIFSDKKHISPTIHVVCATSMRCGVSDLCDNTRFVTYLSTFSRELATGNGTAHKHTRKQGTPNISRSSGNLNLRTQKIRFATTVTFERVVNAILSQRVRTRLTSRNVGHIDVELGRCKIVSKIHVLTLSVIVSINRHSTAPAVPCKRSRDTRHAWLLIRCRCFLSVSKSMHPSARTV